MGDSFAIGIPESEPERAQGSWAWLLALAALFGALLLLITPNFMMCRNYGPLTACKSSCKNIACALEMYAADNHGHYPLTLQQLTVGNYLKTIPTCVSTDAMTYTNYEVAQNPDRFSFACVGNNHAKSYVGYSQPSDNYPQYNSEVGLVDHP